MTKVQAVVTEAGRSEPSTESSDAFVSVGQAAKLLGVSDRTARRMAGQLAANDRTADIGHGRRVRLAAMQTLRSEALQQRGSAPSAFHVESTPGQDADTVAGQWPDSGHGHPVNGRTMAGQDTNTVAELAALRAERDGLKERLADAQKATADTASDRDAWKDQAQTLTEALRAAQDEARAARLMPSRPAMQIEALETPRADSSEGTGSGGGIVSPGTEKRPWWVLPAFWQGRG